MLDLVITICAIYSLAFLIKESSGPCGIISWWRNIMMRNKYIGVFFYKLLDCYFCLGCWTGSIIYLLHNLNSKWHLNQLIIWFLAGGIICLILDKAISKLYQ